MLLGTILTQRVLGVSGQKNLISLTLIGTIIQHDPYGFLEGPCVGFLLWMKQITINLVT